ncbi:MAG TPA: SpoIIE family protein phosphatase [Roseiflexaceae bacterium]|nr:SpoIIE family protein phosphatase [Roseiflexaceae bacterium]HMP40862.1 SpoIIE family protein phosphatase [Roseiflexaceae bacterium]
MGFSMVEHDLLLRRVPLFESLSTAELLQIAETLSEVEVAAGEFLFREGEPGTSLYILLEGEVEVIKALDTAEERLIVRRGPGMFVGEMSLLNGDPRRSASVRVVTPLRALQLTKPDFDALLLQHPLLAFAMLRVMSERLRESHDTAIRDLTEKNKRLAQAYAELQAAQTQLIAQQTLLRELQLARETQESMLPVQIPQLAGVDIGTCMLPARIVGGDFYDIVKLDHDRLGIAVGDVSGKGMPAALFMVLTSSLLRAEIQRSTPPETAVTLLNRHLLERNPQGFFVTLLYGELHLPSRTFHYVRAGHEYPIIWDATGTPLPIPHDVGHPLGLFDDGQLDIQTVIVPPGGTLLLFSDGVTEAHGPDHELFGYERLIAPHYPAHTTSAQGFCDALAQQIERHADGTLQFDDITMVALHLH